MVYWYVIFLYPIMSPSLRSPLFSPSSQNVHFISSPDTLSAESFRVSIDPIALAPAESIPLADHSSTVPNATRLTLTLDHENPPVTNSPPAHHPLLHHHHRHHRRHLIEAELWTKNRSLEIDYKIP